MFTTLEIDRHINCFRKTYKTEEELLEYFFQKKFPKNKDLSEVLAKATLLNKFYSTGISKGDLKIIAEKIINYKNFDDILINDKKYSAVSIIGDTEDGIKNAYVFASKYCSFHYPKKYPIYDYYSWFALYTINNSCNLGVKLKKYPIMNFESYNLYCSALEAFKDKYSLHKEYNYKQLDEFLWTFGRDLKNEG